MMALSLFQFPDPLLSDVTSNIPIPSTWYHITHSLSYKQLHIDNQGIPWIFEGNLSSHPEVTLHN